MGERFKAVLHSRSRSQPNLRQPTHDPEERTLKKSHTIDRQHGLATLAAQLLPDGTQHQHEPSASVKYSSLGGEEILALQISALRKVNELFRVNGLGQLDTGIVGIVRQSATPTKKKWWEKMFSKGKTTRNHGTF